MVSMKEIADNLVQGNGPQVEKLVREALEEGQDGRRVLDEGLMAGLSVVGEKFKNNEIYVPEVLIVARNMKAAMEIIRPYFAEKHIREKGTIVLGTVRGDVHDIGKNILGMALEGAGLRVINLGVDVDTDKFVQVAKEENADLIGLSSLLTTTMPAMKDVISEVNASDLNGKVKVIIGGAPITQDYADEIGADGYASNALTGVDKTKELLAS